MDEDALDVARFAVAATRLWREQMQRDWGDYREPEEILDAAVGELLAERDRLRAVVDAARMVLTVIDSTLVGRMANGIEGRNEITLLRLRLDQLDGSAEAIDG
jgi:hypothetical protein